MASFYTQFDLFTTNLIRANISRPFKRYFSSHMSSRNNSYNALIDSWPGKRKQNKKIFALFLKAFSHPQ